MKPILSLFGRKFLLIFTLSFIVTITSAQDIPVAVPNLETIPSGSLVIPMDNALQATSGGMFNLKAYGFVIDLLNHSYPLKWVIKAGKAHDVIDFTATAERLQPTVLASQSRDFISGPLVILPSDTSGVISHLTNMNDTLPASHKVSIYRLTQSVIVDVRYNLTQPPKVAILNDGAFAQMHVNYMQWASVPTVNYEVIVGVNLSGGCYTLATEPHVESSGTYIDSVRAFVLGGGNFLAQCHAVLAYENAAAGHFHTTGGIVRNNIDAQPTTIYPNSDMAYSQFQGTYTANQTGNTRLWQNLVGSVNQNNCYSVVGNSLYPAVTGASVSKIVSGLGGVVFYLGNHEFDNLTDMGEINGIRMYLNAVLVPAKPNCSYAIWKLLPVKLESFGARKKTEASSEINWTTSNEETGNIYVLERSADGKNFTSIKAINAIGRNSNQTYSHTDIKPLTGANYYRLRIENTSGDNKYSEIKTVVFSKPGMNFSIYPNPAGKFTNLILQEKDGQRLRVSLYDAVGRQVKKIIVTVLNQKAALNLDGLNKGFYSVIVSKVNGEQLKNKLIISK